ncbi:MAG: hypothetical protein Q9194_003066 [Teloschistes cf. exilis]
MRSGIAQSFLESVNASLPPVPQNEDKSATTPDSASCSCCCHCSRSDSWRNFAPRGHRRARSYTATRTGISELTGLDWEPSEPAIVVKAPKVWGPGEAPLERLPVEVLGKLTKRPVNPNGLRLICVKTKLSPNWQLIRNPRDIHHATWT